MRDDDVMRQVRDAREAYARSLGYDLKAIVADLRDQDAKGDRLVVRLAPRRPSAAMASHDERDSALRHARLAAGSESESESDS